MIFLFFKTGFTVLLKEKIAVRIGQAFWFHHFESIFPVYVKVLTSAEQLMVIELQTNRSVENEILGQFSAQDYVDDMLKNCDLQDTLNAKVGEGPMFKFPLALCEKLSFK